MSKLKPNPKRLLLDYCFGLTTETDAAQAKNLAISNSEAANTCTQMNNTEVGAEVIDWSQLIARLVDEEVIKEVIPIFIHDNKERIAKLFEAVESGDIKEITFNTHAIKGAARNVGAQLLSNITSQLECAGREDDLEAILPLLDKLKVEFERVLSFLSQPDWIEIAKGGKVVI